MLAGKYKDINLSDGSFPIDDITIKASVRILSQLGNQYGSADSNDNPFVISGAQVWLRDGKIHRDGDEPAIIYGSGKKEWCVDDKTHREDGPAVINEDGTQEWWIDGQRIR